MSQCALCSEIEALWSTSSKECGYLHWHIVKSSNYTTNKTFTVVRRAVRAMHPIGIGVRVRTDDHC